MTSSYSSVVDRFRVRVDRYRLSMATIGYVQSHKYLQSLKTRNTALESLSADSARLCRISYLCDKKYFSYSDIMNMNSTQKSKILSYMLSTIKPFCYTIYPLSLDDISYTDIDIEKSQIPQGALADTIAILKAYKMNLVPPASQCHCAITDIGYNKISCKVSYARIPHLQNIAKLYRYNIYFVNPLDIFCHIYYFYPSLHFYTIIVRDKRTHALCHYKQGALIYSVIIDRQDALDSYYTNIANLGLILYYDFNGDCNGLQDFISVDELLGYPTHSSIELLCIAHVYNRPLWSNFYLRDFYTMRSIVYACIASIALALILCFCVFLFDRYEYYRVLREQDREYLAHMQQEFRKKQSYTPMYLRIYSHIKENKDLNFSIKQHYDGEKWVAQ